MVAMYGLPCEMCASFGSLADASLLTTHCGILECGKVVMASLPYTNLTAWYNGKVGMFFVICAVTKVTILINTGSKTYYINFFVERLCCT